jgi:hypothetical protein
METTDSFYDRLNLHIKQVYCLWPKNSGRSEVRQQRASGRLRYCPVVNLLLNEHSKL